MKTRVIGVGNPDRGDDAAGLMVARRLRALGLDAREESGEASSLLEAWRGCERVILVDAVVTGAEPGRALVWDARRQRLPREAFRCSTHSFGVADAVELGRILDRLPPELEIHGIEGSAFEMGAGPGAAVAAAVERVAGEIASRLQDERKLAKPHTSGA